MLFKQAVQHQCFLNKCATSMLFKQAVQHQCFLNKCATSMLFKQAVQHQCFLNKLCNIKQAVQHQTSCATSMCNYAINRCGLHKSTPERTPTPVVCAHYSARMYAFSLKSDVSTITCLLLKCFYASSSLLWCTHQNAHVALISKHVHWRNHYNSP